MRTKNALLVLLTVAAISILGAAFAGDFGTVPWMVNRATGLVAYALLSVSVIAGLLMSTKSGKRLLSRPAVLAAHQYISLLAVGFIGAHGLALLFDGFLQITPVDVFVPFASSYERFLTGLGVTAGWLTAIVWASFSFRKELGTKRWRQLHYGSFGAYVMTFFHGFFGGTDSQLPLVMGMYLVSAGAVGAFVCYRLAGAIARLSAGRQRPRPERREIPGRFVLPR